MLEAESSAGPMRRVVFDVGDASRGPTLLVIAGMHGNEPAGVRALTRVAARIDERVAGDPGALRGRIIGVLGNIEALRRGQRFIDRDLNRRWDAWPGQLSLVDVLAVERSTGDAELAEQKALLSLVSRIELAARGPLYVLDLHSTSSPSPAFCVPPDASADIQLALALGVPVIIGLEEATDGTMIGWLHDRGHIALAFEGGAHSDPSTEVRHVAATLLVAIKSGILAARAVDDRSALRAVLRASAHGLPRVVEVVLRHPVAPADHFSMLPGFATFHPVARGRPLAHDVRGTIHAAASGRLLLPLYQGQGEDGFFIGREVSRVELRAWMLARALRLERWLAHAAGAEHDSACDRIGFAQSRALGDSHAATDAPPRWARALGFRKRAAAPQPGARWALARRRPADARPWPESLD